MTDRIKPAIDSNLSALTARCSDFEAVRQKMQGETIVKKKVSLALVLTIVLVLLSAAALAAVLLGGREVVNEIIEPLAMKKTDTLLFTREEVEEVIKKAEEHGVTLKEDVLKKIRQSGNYFKEELAMAFSREAFGGNFYTWDVADQLWFEEFWMRIDDSFLYTSRTVPQEGELSQQQIEETAARLIRERHGQEYPLSDRSLYRLERSFTDVKNNPYRHTRTWRLHYFPLRLDLPEFNIELTPQGEVLNWQDTQTLLADWDVDGRAQYLSYRLGLIYDDNYGATDWPQEAWQALHLGLKELYKKGEPGENYRNLLYALKQSYAPFGPDTLSREEASRIAAKALAEKFSLDAEKLLKEPEDFSGRGQYLYALGLDGDTQPVWKVSFGRDWLAEIDAKTGEVLVADQYSPGNDHYRRYVRDTLIAPERRAFATKAPKPREISPEELEQKGNEPLIRRDDSFGNDTYWQAIMNLNYTSNRAGRVWGEPVRDYGEDERFWPLDMQAFVDLYNRVDRAQGYRGVPLEGDLTQEQALQLAEEAFQKGSTETRSEELQKMIKPAFSFYYDSEGKGSRSWHITFMDVQGEMAGPIFKVVVNAVTGEIVTAESRANG